MAINLTIEKLDTITYRTDCLSEESRNKYHIRKTNLSGDGLYDQKGYEMILNNVQGTFPDKTKGVFDIGHNPYGNINKPDQNIHFRNNPSNPIICDKLIMFGDYSGLDFTYSSIKFKRPAILVANTHAQPYKEPSWYNDYPWMYLTDNNFIMCDELYYNTRGLYVKGKEYYKNPRDFGRLGYYSYDRSTYYAEHTVQELLDGYDASEDYHDVDFPIATFSSSDPGKPYTPQSNDVIKLGINNYHDGNAYWNSWHLRSLIQTDTILSRLTFMYSDGDLVNAGDHWNNYIGTRHLELHKVLSSHFPCGAMVLPDTCLDFQVYRGSQLYTHLFVDTTHSPGRAWYIEDFIFIPFLNSLEYNAAYAATSFWYTDIWQKETAQKVKEYAEGG